MAGSREGGGGEGGKMKGGGGEGGVRVAVRVRPFNGRERQMESRLVVDMAGETQVETTALMRNIHYLLVLEFISVLTGEPFTCSGRHPRGWLSCWR